MTAATERWYDPDATLKRFPTWEVDESALDSVHASTAHGFASVPIQLG
jgi:hypothetical protein